MVSKYPVDQTINILMNTHAIKAGNIRSPRFLKYVDNEWFFSKERLIKKPLMKKKIGTPGNRRMRSNKRLLVISCIMISDVCKIITWAAAINLISSRLFSLKLQTFILKYYIRNL
jgi:hypothetical protein